MLVPNSGNFIIRNTSTANTFTYSITDGNRYGPIVPTGAAAQGMAGNSAPDTTHTTSPWANITD